MTPPSPDTLPFEHSYAALPERFRQFVAPTPVAAPRLLAFNDALAAELGVADALRGDAALAMFAGNHVPAHARPLAMAYAGHQFGQFVPQLGDGRAILLGELIDIHGARRDVQLKGAGPTAFSRRGDGRAAIGPVLREYLVSEAMHALGVPTTRALAAVATGEPVLRDGVVPGAVLVRVAASHVRVGTFEYFAARGDSDGVRLLADIVIDRHYPDLAGRDDRHLALLEAVAARQAALVAMWMHAGFVHGVMNTDNMAVSGETIDYGPCAFLDEYHPGKTFSSIDRHGRYAYANQAPVAQWNLARLAEALLPLVDAALGGAPVDPQTPASDAAMDAVVGVIEAFPERFHAHWLRGMRHKLGLAGEHPGDGDLVNGLLAAMQASGADWTLTFRHLCADADPTRGIGARTPADAGAPELGGWLPRWRERRDADGRSPGERGEAMCAANPAVIPRNHRVEAALAAAAQGDLALFEALLAAVRRPFDDGDAQQPFMTPPAPAERVTQTFCGT